MALVPEEDEPLLPALEEVGGVVDGDDGVAPDPADAPFATLGIVPQGDVVGAVPVFGVTDEGCPPLGLEGELVGDVVLGTPLVELDPGVVV